MSNVVKLSNLDDDSVPFGAQPAQSAAGGNCAPSGCNTCGPQAPLALSEEDKQKTVFLGLTPCGKNVYMINGQRKIVREPIEVVERPENPEVFRRKR